MAQQVCVVASADAWAMCQTPSAVSLATPASALPLPSVVMRRFRFDTPALRWRVEHGMGTPMVMHIARDLDGNLLYAPVDPVDDNTLLVRLTSATAGYVDVLFST